MDFYTLSEILEKFSITGQTLRRWQKQGLFPIAIKHGRCRLWPKAEIDQLTIKTKIGRPHISPNKIKVAKRFLEKNVEMPIIIYGLQLSEDEIKTLD